MGNDTGGRPQVTRLQRVSLHTFSEHFELNHSTYRVQFWADYKSNLHDMLDLITIVVVFKIERNSNVESNNNLF